MENQGREWYLKNRYLLIIFILSLGLSIYLDIRLHLDDSPLPLSKVASDYLFYLIFIFLLYVIAKKAELSWQSLFGKFDFEFIASKYILIVLPLVILSVGGIFLLYYPLSFLQPDFINEWLFNDEINIIWFSGEHYRLANLLSFLLVVIIGPVIEEIFFRGLLLTSLANKYNITKAIIITSLIFGFLHVDILGVILAGVVLSVVYIKTRSLYAPIIIHVSNNAISFISEYFFRNSNYNITDLQRDWWIGLIALIIGVTWFIYFYKREIAKKSFSIPYFYNLQE